MVSPAPKNKKIERLKDFLSWNRFSYLCPKPRGRSRLGRRALRLQLHALAFNLADFLHTLALPDSVERWSLTSLRYKSERISARSS